MQILIVELDEAAKDTEEARQMAIAVALALLDFRMQYRSLSEIDHV